MTRAGSRRRLPEFCDEPPSSAGHKTSERRPVAAKALATRHSLPPRHLEPVLQALVRHGILKGVRGPRGGYELARERSRITADDIMRAAGTVDEVNGMAFADSLLLSKVVMPAL